MYFSTTKWARMNIAPTDKSHCAIHNILPTYIRLAIAAVHVNALKRRYKL